MAAKSNIPRFKIGESVYRVEWKKDVPFIAEYKVREVTTGAFTADNKAGKPEEFAGKTVLPLFATTTAEAVDLAFEAIAKQVVKDKSNIASQLKMAVRLGQLTW
ncbi:MAG TPA: hypothetical protein DC058_22340 [Planctomycetaceae bacterium]|nr:hypothetical protein [Planctomycetaceae bacterium]